MANYATLKAAVLAAIAQNGNQEITGPVLQAQLLDMISSLGADYQYAGIATPSGTPGTPDENVFFLASTPGTYTNYGGLTVADGEVAILKYNGSWAKDATGIASAKDITLLRELLFLQIMPLDIQSTTWYDGGYTHLTLPVSPGDVISWTKNGNTRLYYSFLTAYTGAVLGDTPSFASGYSGRQNSTVAFTVPEGTAFLVVNNPNQSGQELLTLKVNGVDVLGGIWNGVGNLAEVYSALAVSQEAVKSAHGYAVCYTAAATAEKAISSSALPGLVLDKDVRLLITFSYANTAENASLKIGTRSSYPIYYRGSRATTGNTWADGDTLDVRFSEADSVFYAVPHSAVITMDDKDVILAGVLQDSDLTIESVSHNIANPDYITDGQSVNNNGAIINQPSLIGTFQTLTLPVEEGQIISFGGFDLERAGYYAFYSGTTLISVASFTRNNGINGKTVTVPQDADLLYINIQMSGNPETPQPMANYGAALLPYEPYEERITKINGILLAGSGGSGGGSSLSEIVVDLPVSDGSNIPSGYAYIDSSTRVVKVKE